MLDLKKILSYVEKFNLHLGKLNKIRVSVLVVRSKDN